MHQGHQFVDDNLKYIGKLEKMNYKKKLNQQTKVWLRVPWKPMGENMRKILKQQTYICGELLATTVYMHKGIDTINCMTNHKYISK